ncbi:ATP-binding protein [uncultured Treponema sp.]|uniref:ATP-binding protein n=1 Tax=uncultured Treponema sp. TaxID=162155 RepID=UPI0035A5CC30
MIPRRRNEVICSILEYCRYMESKGSVFDKIEQDYAGKGESYKPYISADTSSFTLILPNLTFAPGVIDENTIPEIHIEGILNEKMISKFFLIVFQSPVLQKKLLNIWE